MNRHKGVTLIELLVLLAILGVLLMLLLPALHKAQESARQMICVNNLRQIGLALHQYHETYKSLPPGWTAYAPPRRAWPTGQPRWGWALRISPYLDLDALPKDLFHEDLPLTHPDNQFVRTLPISKFRCPSDLSPDIFEIGKKSATLQMASANYLGVFGSSEMAGVVPQVVPFQVVGNGVFFHNSAVKFRDIADGLNCTIFVGESDSKPVANIFHTWVGCAEGDCFGKLILGSSFYPLDAVKDGAFGSKHPTGANFLLGDGSVRLFSPNIDQSIYHALSTRQDHDSTGDFLFKR